MSTEDLPSIEAWLAFSPDQKREVLEGLRARLGAEFRLVRTIARGVERRAPSAWQASEIEREHAALATNEQASGWAFRHSSTGVSLRFVPGATTRIGLSDEELEALEARCTWTQTQQLRDGMARARPPFEATVRPFLIAAAPLTGRSLQALGLRLDDPKVSRLYSALDQVTYLDPSEVAPLLRATPFRLPTEVEWEHACRAGTRTPFFWGTKLPDRPSRRRNALGLSELGNHPELCADRFRDTYAPEHKTATPVLRPVRGGAASLYPWQDCGEWLLLLSAWRMAVDPSGDPIDRQVCLRLCVDLS